MSRTDNTCRPVQSLFREPNTGNILFSFHLCHLHIHILSPSRTRECGNLQNSSLQNLSTSTLPECRHVPIRSPNLSYHTNSTYRRTWRQKGLPDYRGSTDCKPGWQPAPLLRKHPPQKRFRDGFLSEKKPDRTRLPTFHHDPANGLHRSDDHDTYQNIHKAHHRQKEVPVLPPNTFP